LFLTMTDLLPLFVNLEGRRVVLVGGGLVAAGKLAQLRAARADVLVVAPDVHDDIAQAGVVVVRRPFMASDLDGAWLVVAAATPDVNRAVAAAAAERRIFVNAVDDPANATAYLGGVVRRGGVTLAISTSGEAPGLAGLLREAIDAVLPRELGRWLREARRQRRIWRRAGVPISARRPLLLDALNRLYDVGREPTPLDPDVGDRHQDRVGPGELPGPVGHVSLVGAGPGDPALLTRKAAARLRAADLVLYDALVDSRVLKIAGRAQRFFVGKRAGRHALTQTEIHTIMIRAARRGRRVVRLKGGDPFVFGRGGEEALALKDAGVRFDVVPGVTSAVAAAALAGIPVTQRGIATAFLTVSGHDEEVFDEALEGVPCGAVTLVILMGIGRRTALARRLMARGWPAEIPAAIVAGASLPEQYEWRGTLGTLAADHVEVDSDSPAVIVVGGVAALDASDRCHRSDGRERTDAMRASQG
jgi:uroporphyrin-III C-methyltransferase/precorrin-2 dehydrogenase/sirohydrochlorin ferrochelatase